MADKVPSTTILKVLVGSQAHGLAGPTSDNDYRGVFVVPTREFFRIGRRPHNTSWIESDNDNTSWEIGHFLNLAVKCNPTVLETFLAPAVTGNKETSAWGHELQDLFPYVWNSLDAKEAFIGYGLNQRKKFLDSLSEEYLRPKFAVAYLRTLYQAYELLTTGRFTIRVADTPIGTTLQKWRAGNFKSPGEVIDLCQQWTYEVEQAFLANPDKKADLSEVEDFLGTVRLQFWS